MSATIYDIAEKANVSIATVSRVFSNHPRVSDKTREKVLAIADQYQYFPNVSAQTLARQNSYMIAAVVPMLTNYFFMEVLRGVQEQMALSDFELMVFSVSDPSESLLHLQKATQKGRSEGVFLFSTYLTDADAKKVVKNTHPLMMVDCYHAAFESLCVDNVFGGYQATQHLLAQGYTKIALLGAAPISIPAQERKKGFLKAMEEAGIAVPPTMMQDCMDCAFHGFSENSGYITAQKIFENHPDVEAFFAMSDIQALGAMQAIKERGRVIGKDIAIIGFDDIQVAQYVGLSTVRQPMYEMGQKAFDILKAKIEGTSKIVKQEKLAPRLIIRDSSIIS